MLEKLTKIRRDLHQIPELSFDLYKTHDYVMKLLVNMGYETYVTAQTGIVAVKHGTTNQMIAFRSDMDALPVTEKTGVDFKSKHEGKMHACGHDGHMAMLLGFADKIKDIKLKSHGIMLIFQPAEEFPGGAKIIVEEGFLKRFNVIKIFGIHLYPELEEMKFGFVPGAMMARNGEFNLTLKGKSSHGAQPHHGNDAILAVSHLIHQYHSIISRNIDPLEPCVLTVGTIEGGEARNIIASTVKIKGTVRAFNDKVYELIKNRMKAIEIGIEHSFDVKIEQDFQDFYPIVYNDLDIYQHVIHQFNDSEYQVIEKMTVSEDFSFYQQVVPGMFIMLGTRNINKDYIYPLHHSKFNFDEKVLLKGVEYYDRIAKSYHLYE
ncbi:MAG: M20 family metallopeptidase [Acholeplasmataceae bacterium]|nr:amidohydrolase [Acholeplasmataceae bacterium]